jgi:hypothetical protein
MIKVIVPCRVVVTQATGRITSLENRLNNPNSNPTVSTSLRWSGEIPSLHYRYAVLNTCVTRARYE